MRRGRRPEASARSRASNIERRRKREGWKRDLAVTADDVIAEMARE
jgi:hypothetical protein